MKTKLAGALVALLVGWLVVAIAPPALALGFGQIAGTVFFSNPGIVPGDSFNVQSNGADSFTAAESAAASLGSPAADGTADASLSYTETFQGTDLTSVVVNGSATTTIHSAAPVGVHSGADNIYSLNFSVSQDVSFSLAGSLSLVSLDVGQNTSAQVGFSGPGVDVLVSLVGPTDSTVPVSASGTLVAGSYSFTAFAHSALPGVGGVDQAGFASFDLTLTLGTPPPACDNVFTDGSDSIVGTEGDDTLCGGGGNDRIRGLGGNDTIDGGLGVDTIIGGDGDDVIDGGDDVDTILGGRGNDTIHGGGGADNIEDTLGPLGGNDIIDGGDGNDTIDGGSGNDVIEGDGDDDVIDGLFGDDVIDGGDGNDTIDGGSGNDTIFGGDNAINGGDGEDIINGGDDDDTIFGGARDDDISGGFDDGSDTLAGGNGNDLIDGGGGFDTIDGGDGNDRLFAADGTADVVDGGNDFDRAQVDRVLDVVNNVERLRRV